MSTPPELARRLLAACRSGSEPHADEVVLVSEKLRTTLSRLVGADGFASLMRRALALASEEVPSLQSVKVGTDGRLGGWEQAAGGGEAALAIVSHLLGLLITFIGEPLALQLVRQAWPELPLEQLHPKDRGQR